MAATAHADDDNDEQLHDLFFDAARFDDIDDVQQALKSDPRLVSARDPSQRTALHLAAANGHVAIVKALLAAGADAGAENQEKNTPMHYAAINGHVEAVKLLLAAGASPAVLNSFERTPFDDAQSRNNAGVLQAIAEHCKEEGNGQPSDAAAMDQDGDGDDSSS